MYSATQVWRGLRDPRKIFLELNTRYHRQIRGREGMKVLERDWDNLIILDGCRFDTFQQVNTISGELTTEISPGARTPEFIEETFEESSYPDIVYVSANPQLHKIDSAFHDRIRLWETHWDDDLQTVLPSSVVDQTIKIAQRYPHKRIIIHFIQPHYPFIGETGQQIRQGSFTGDGQIREETEYPTVWQRFEAGDLDEDTVRRAYRENAELAVEGAKQIVETLEGKSVVTSDHGNAFGEWGVYGHPTKKYLTPLVKVPWLVADFDHRKKIIKASTVKNEQRSDDKVQNRLSALGYK